MRISLSTQNENEARYANNGGLPPDLSLIIKVCWPLVITLVFVVVSLPFCCCVYLVWSPCLATSVLSTRRTAAADMPLKTTTLYDSIEV